MTTFTTSFTNAAGDAWATVTEVVYVTTYVTTSKSNVRTLTLSTTVDAASTELLARLTQLSTSSSTTSRPHTSSSFWTPQPPDYHQPGWVPLSSDIKVAIGVSVGVIVLCWTVLLALTLRRRRKAKNMRENASGGESIAGRGASNGALPKGQLLPMWKAELSSKPCRTELDAMQESNTAELDNSISERNRAELENARSERDRAELDNASRERDIAELDHARSPTELDGFVLGSMERHEVAGGEPHRAEGVEQQESVFNLRKLSPIT